LFSDLWLRLKDVLKATAGQRCYISVYWDGVDTLSHYYGAHNDYLRQEIAMQLQLLRGVLNDPNMRDGQTLFMLIADHGHHDVQSSVDLTTEPAAQPIAAALRSMPSGDRRFGYLHLQPGTLTQVEQTLAVHYSDRFAWAVPSTAAEAGLFGSGTPHPEFFARAGDLLITPRLGSSLISPAKPHKPGPLYSMHAGLTDWEMLVPLLWKRI
jgi:predicted AlkP superfamily pyrophosphatase or phosphodiesterase